MGREINLDFYFDIKGNCEQYGCVRFSFSFFVKSGKESHSDVINGEEEWHDECSPTQTFELDEALFVHTSSWVLCTEISEISFINVGLSFDTFLGVHFIHTFYEKTQVVPGGITQ